MSCADRNVAENARKAMREAMKQRLVNVRDGFTYKERVVGAGGVGSGVWGCGLEDLGKADGKE